MITPNTNTQILVGVKVYSDEALDPFTTNPRVEGPVAPLRTFRIPPTNKTPFFEITLENWGTIPRNYTGFWLQNTDNETENPLLAVKYSRSQAMKAGILINEN